MIAIGGSINHYYGVLVKGAEARAKFWSMTCPCGAKVEYPINGLPETDTRFPCGNPYHWAVLYNEEGKL